MSEQNQTENNTPEEQTDPTPLPRDKKGKFAPKPSAPIQHHQAAEPPITTSSPEKDELLDEIEADLTKALKGRIDPKELDGLDQRMRIKMMRILEKVDNGKRNETIDPTSPPPPAEVHIPTLAERNRADKYRADMLKQGSYVGLTDKWRKG